MVINVLLNLLFIPLLGIQGAALSALISFSVMFFIGLYFVPKVISGYRFRRLIKISLPIFISGIIMAFCAYYFNQIMSYLYVIPLGAIIYLICLYFTRAIPKEHLSSVVMLLKSEKKSYEKNSSFDN